MLFQLCINDINNAITSLIKLSADDSVLYENIRNQNNQLILQNYLDTMSSFDEKWLMELSINKCSVLSTTLKRNSIFGDNDILGATHKWVANHDYLGVTTSSDLNWLRQAKIYIIRLEEPLVYLKEPFLPCHKT